jgi:hypothetical protein
VALADLGSAHAVLAGVDHGAGEHLLGLLDEPGGELDHLGRIVGHGRHQRGGLIGGLLVRFIG